MTAAAQGTRVARPGLEAPPRRPQADLGSGRGPPLQALHHHVGNPGEVAHVRAHAARRPGRGSIRSAGPRVAQRAGRRLPQASSPRRPAWSCVPAPAPPTQLCTAGGPAHQGRVGAARAPGRASQDPGRLRANRDPAVGSSRVAVPALAGGHQHAHTALPQPLICPLGGRQQRTEDAGSGPQGVRSCLRRVPLPSPGTAREDTKGADSGPPSRGKGHETGRNQPEAKPHEGGGL